MKGKFVSLAIDEHTSCIKHHGRKCVGNGLEIDELNRLSCSFSL